MAFDIDKPAKLTWNAVTTRKGGEPVTGAISYIVNIVGGVYTADEPLSFNTTAPEQALDWRAIGIAPGEYDATVYAIEEQGGTGRMSPASSPYPFALFEILPPEAPTGLSIA